MSDCPNCARVEARFREVEAELSRLREERDEHAYYRKVQQTYGEEQFDRAEAAEAEASRLREERDELAEQGRISAVRYGENFTRRMAAEARCAAMEECDCIPAPFSSKACGKCGRRGVVTETTVHSLMVEIRDAKARCARLQQALDGIESTIGTMSLNGLAGDQQKAIAEAWGMAREKRPDPQLVYATDGKALAGPGSEQSSLTESGSAGLPDTPADSHYRERPIEEDFYLDPRGEWVYRWSDERRVLKLADSQEDKS